MEETSWPPPPAQQRGQRFKGHWTHCLAGTGTAWLALAPGHRHHGWSSEVKMGAQAAAGRQQRGHGCSSCAGHGSSGSGSTSTGTCGLVPEPLLPNTLPPHQLTVAWGQQVDRQRRDSSSSSSSAWRAWGWQQGGGAAAIAAGCAAAAIAMLDVRVSCV